MTTGVCLRVRIVLPDNSERFLDSDLLPVHQLPALLDVASRFTKAGFPAFVAEQHIKRHEPEA